jgi:hypothetical protein
MNHRVPSDSIERGWSLASSVCRNVPPRYAGPYIRAETHEGEE